MFKKFYKKYKSLPFVFHPFTIILALFMYYINKFDVFLAYLISATIHELGHFFVAKKYGYKNMQVKLMPYGAELCGKFDNIRYIDEIKISLAGPITSFLLSITIVCIWWIIPEFYYFTEELMWASLVCGLFNFLPIYPLDGGRVVVAHLSKKIKREEAVYYSQIVSKCFGAILIFIFFLTIRKSFNISFLIVGLMMFISGFAKTNQNYIFIKTKEKTKENIGYGVEECVLIIRENMPVYKLIRKLKMQMFYVFRVVNEDSKILFEFNELSLNNLNDEDLTKSILDCKTKLLKNNK